ncbi:MAG TPA: NAD(P)-dependent oxidoreductase [Devosiaceae bacterium]|nr:NAD(P)-dependent oxidoreductase [Devosiaceae bacterium]
MTHRNNRRTVLVTGAGGNLGSKLVAHLAGLDWCETIFGLDIAPMEGAPFDSPKFRPVVSDLGDAHDRRWFEAVAEADAIVHFAVRNPAPSGNWDDAVIAIDMTANLIHHANPKGCRFLYASSNHAMGQYKDLDWSKVGPLSQKTPPLPGTRYFSGGGYHQPNMYGGSKLTGERMLRAKAIASGGSFTAVSLRIGWCLSGDSDPRRINAKGGGSGGAGAAVQSLEEEGRDLTWFRNMWLSDRDFVAEFEAALTADASSWPEPGIVVNAMSANRGMLWDMEDAKKYLGGYTPRDDVWTTLGIDPPRPSKG